MKEYIWNPWHGCIKYSEGCRNCYVYRRDETVGRDASMITKNADFDLPVKRGRNGYKIPSGSTVYLCMTSDFFIDRADVWRDEIWRMIRLRYDVDFIIITKRVLRLPECFPDDWDTGYPNITIVCTIENQDECNNRLAHFLSLPIKKKGIVCEPLLSAITLHGLSDEIKFLICGGESENDARVCDYDWVLDIRKQCIDAGVSFRFKQTGARFLKGGKLYKVPRKLQHSQAKKAGINT